MLSSFGASKDPIFSILTDRLFLRVTIAVLELVSESPEDITDDIFLGMILSSRLLLKSNKVLFWDAWEPPPPIWAPMATNDACSGNICDWML